MVVEYGMEEMGHGVEADMDNMDEHQENYDEGHYGEEGEESFNFEDNPEYAHMPPLDRMRKIRRAILQTINDMRQAHQSPSMYIDVMANKAANEYANYLLNNGEDESKVDEICKAYFVSG